MNEKQNAPDLPKHLDSKASKSLFVALFFGIIVAFLIFKYKLNSMSEDNARALKDLHGKVEILQHECDYWKEIESSNLILPVPNKYILGAKALRRDTLLRCDTFLHKELNR